VKGRKVLGERIILRNAIRSSRCRRVPGSTPSYRRLSRTFSKVQQNESRRGRNIIGYRRPFSVVHAFPVIRISVCTGLVELSCPNGGGVGGLSLRERCWRITKRARRLLENRFHGQRAVGGFFSDPCPCSNFWPSLRLLFARVVDKSSPVPDVVRATRPKINQIVPFSSAR